MSTNAARRLEAWLLLAGMLAAMAWYAKPQLTLSVEILRYLFALGSTATGG